MQPPLIFPTYCANPNCKTQDCIYPSDEIFYIDEQYFYFCCEKCKSRTQGCSISLKTLGVNKNRQKTLATVNAAKTALGW